MAESSGEFTITNGELGQIARIIKAEHMPQIATDYLGLDQKEFSKIELGSKRKVEDSEWKRNYKALKLWRSQNGGEGTREVGVSIHFSQ